MNARESVVSGLHALPATEAIRAISAVATVRAGEPGPLRSRWNEIASIATAPSPDRTLVAVLANLDETDRGLISTLIAALTSPGLSGIRGDLRSGAVGLTVEDGEITFAAVVSRDLPRRDAFRQIVCALSRITGVTETELLSNARGEDRVSFARQIGMTLYRELTDCTWEHAGETFGRWHRTATHAAQVVHDRCATSQRDRALVNRVRDALGMAEWKPAPPQVEVPA